MSTYQIDPAHTHAQFKVRHMMVSNVKGVFDVEKFPTITFVSTGVVKSGEDSFEVVGDLTIHGVTNAVDLDVEDVTPEMKDPFGFFRRGATAKATILRSDFGLKYNAVLETGGVVIGDEVHITIDVEFTRKA